MKIKGSLKYILGEINKKYENETDYKEYICLLSKKETKEMRTLYQNNMFYGLFLEISKHIGEEVEDIKFFFLSIFGQREVSIGKKTMVLNKINHTSDLDKKQARFFIDVILKFIEKYKVPCKYTSRDFENLLETYNLK